MRFLRTSLLLFLLAACTPVFASSGEWDVASSEITGQTHPYVSNQPQYGLGFYVVSRWYRSGIAEGGPLGMYAESYGWADNSYSSSAGITGEARATRSVTASYSGSDPSEYELPVSCTGAVAWDVQADANNGQVSYGAVQVAGVVKININTSPNVFSNPIMMGQFSKTYFEQGPWDWLGESEGLTITGHVTTPSGQPTTVPLQWGGFPYLDIPGLEDRFNSTQSFTRQFSGNISNNISGNPQNPNLVDKIKADYSTHVVISKCLIYNNAARSYVSTESRFTGMAPQN